MPAAAQQASLQAAAEAKGQTQSLSRTASKTKEELASETATVKKQVADTTSQLEAAKALRPGMEETQKQLATALEQVKAQQQVISSSQNFVKEIFSSYTTDIVKVGTSAPSTYAVIPPVSGLSEETAAAIGCSVRTLAYLLPAARRRLADTLDRLDLL